MLDDTDPVFVLGASGHRMYIDPADQRAQQLLRAEGALTPGSNRLWDAVLSLEHWDVVVDVGANYGEMVVGAEIEAASRIVCFEPSTQVLPHLRRSIAESGRAIDLREVALGASEGEATFAVDTVWSGRSGLSRTHRTDADHVVREVSVQVRTLDAELALSDADRVCVKVDVEGAEFDVLAGARGLTERRQPWAIMMEVLHMDGFEKAHLAREFTMRAMDTRTGELVVVPPASAMEVDHLLGAGWLHGQDVVLTARAAA